MFVRGNASVTVPMVLRIIIESGFSGRSCGVSCACYSNVLSSEHYIGIFIIIGVVDAKHSKTRGMRKHSIVRKQCATLLDE